MPEVVESLSFKRLRWHPDNEGAAPWAKWAEYVKDLLKEKGKTSKDVMLHLFENPKYVEGILSGELSPIRDDVQQIARDLGENPIKHELLAGYLPESAQGMIDIIEKLIQTELTADDHVKAMVRSMLDQSASKAKDK
jgi:hypothetical protein